MRFEIDIFGGSVRLVPTTEEDRSELFKLDKTLDGGIGHQNYSLRQVLANISGKTEQANEVRYAIVRDAKQEQ